MKKYLLLAVIPVALLLFAMLAFSLSPEKTNTLVLGAQSTFTGLSPKHFNQELRTENYKLLDIRTMKEYNTGHLANATQIDFYQTQLFSEYLDTLDKNAQYLIYCQSGNRSRNALSVMKQKGFTSVWDLSGGYNAWTATGLPIE